MAVFLVPGSLGAIAARDGLSLAESFLSADVIVLVDVSGSMNACDSRGGLRRFDVACTELARLQATLPGKIAVVAFASDVMFTPGGVPQFAGTSTDLARALRFVAPADGTVRFICVSDGCPDDEMRALAVAKKFTSQIDTVYCGSEGDSEGGREFLFKLAHASGGRFVTADCAADLADRVETLLLRA